MSKKPAFESKASADMYRCLEDQESEPGSASVRPRQAPSRGMMSGPFDGELTRERVMSMQSNVEMEDVSGTPQIVAAQGMPRAPTFTGVTREEKRLFVLKYNAYVKSLQPFYTSGSVPLVASFSSCLDENVKEHLAEFVFDKPVDEIDEFTWMKHFKDCEEAERKDLTVLDAKMSQLKLDLSLGDATSMLDTLTKTIRSKTKEMGLLEYVKKNDPKRLVKYVHDALEPPLFKARVTRHLELESSKHEKKDWVKFCAYLRGDLLNFLEYNPVEIPRKKQEPKKGPATGGKRQGQNAAGETPPSRQPEGGNPSRPKGFACLKCRSPDHDVFQCPQTTDVEAEALLKAFREKRAEQRKKKKSDSQEPKGQVKKVQVEKILEPERLTARIEGCLEAEVLLDSGADCSLISRGLVKALESKLGFLKMALLDEPKIMGTAGSDLEVRRIVCLDSLVFQTSAGPLRCRSLQCYVDEKDSGQLLLLDRPTMEKMGYSADALLVAAKRSIEAAGLKEMDCTADQADPENQKTFVRFMRQKNEALYRSPDDEEEDEYEEVMFSPITQSVGDQMDQIREILAQKTAEAVDNGLSEGGHERLRGLLAEHVDIFRVSFANDPPIDVEPMEIKLIEDARPVMSKSRRYPPLHRKYLQEHMEELEKFGLVYKNPEARWGSSPRVVSKKDGSLRMTVDLRRVNELTVPRAWPMPHQEAEMADLEGSKCFFNGDGFKQYWQEGLGQNSRELLSIVTPSGIYTPTRVLMGATDAVAYTQEAMERIMAPLLNRGVKVWLDDILGYATNELELLDRLEEMFRRCVMFGLKLHPGKCDFFKKSVKWCGKIINAQGVSHCPVRIQGLVEMQVPQTAAELQQFLCACNWMRASIPMYNEVASELSSLLETCMAKSSSRKKNKLAKILLSDCGWSEVHDQAWVRFKSVLMEMVPLAHPKEDWDVCVFTDASQDHWGGVVTQVRPGELSKSREDQEHEPLAFLSGSFKNASSRWPIVEKEAFAIVETCKRMEYLLLRERGFHLFTDHRNLKYIFDPHSVNSDVAKYQADKLQRWSMVLQMFKYEIEYISGEENVWGDLLSRWGSRPSQVLKKKILRLVSTAPLKDEDFKWPSFGEIAEEQAKRMMDMEGLRQDPVNKCLVNQTGQVWIPGDAMELKQRLCVVAHAGLAGHRGINTTVKSLKEVFVWKGMQNDVTAFVNGCLHCLVVDGQRVPRPFGETLTATKPNESIHFDYMKLPMSKDGDEYVLVIKDAMSGFVELVACHSCTAEECVTALCDWFKRYGPAFQWVSDQGSHFKNQVLDGVAKSVGASHHFVTAYCPWANGTVEVANRMLLKVLKSMLSEERLQMSEWPKLLAQVQMALNFNPSPRLNGVAPVTAFLALPAHTPLKTFYMSKYNGKLPQVTEVQWSQEVQGFIQDLQASLEQMHQRLAAAAAAKLTSQRARQKAKSRPPNFELGDYVLVGRTLARGNKLALEWKGPCRIVGVQSHWLFDVQTLFDPVVTSTHHVSRLKFYVDKDRGCVEDLKAYAVAHQDMFLVDRLMECRRLDDGVWEVKVKWQGFDEAEYTWESLASLQADVPVLLKKCLIEVPHPSFQALKTFLAAGV